MAKIFHDQGNLIGFQVDDDVLALFKAISWYSEWKANPRIGFGDHLWVAEDAKVVPYVGLYAGHNMPRIGPFSYTSSSLECWTRVGAYCSISWNLRIMGNNHMMEKFSTTGGLYGAHAIFEDAYAAVQKKPSYLPNQQKAAPVFGNDVWVGQDVLLSRGISIGDGAVIAAGAVVTKNVAPYTIVGGVPARLIRERFSKEEQALLQSSRWWDYLLPDLVPLATNKIEGFINNLEKAKADGSIRKIPTYNITFADLLRSDGITAFIESLATKRSKSPSATAPPSRYPDG